VKREKLRIAVVGDSVAWGQGLLQKDKYPYLVAHSLGGDVEVVMCAHSGARINIPGSTTRPNVTPEVPTASPTIISQIDAVADPDQVDILLLNGGINDVDVRKIMNPSTTTEELSLMTKSACYGSMKALLQRSIAVLGSPQTRFFVTGYYPILSQQSELAPKSEPDPVRHLLSLFGVGFPIYLDRQPIFDKLCSLALQFWHESDLALANAVSEISQQCGLNDRLRFVPCPFSEKNALFAPEPMLFGLSETLGPQDEVIETRKEACSLQYPDPLDLLSREACYHASIGHPNVPGAKLIAEALLEALGTRAV
jgi:lysophospholipase L1-like esterase